MKKVLIILGHPLKESFNGTLADAYEKGVRSAGIEVRRINLGDVKFDPVLRYGLSKKQKLESGLVKAQKDIKWANHLVFVFPNWWSTMPSLLKGFIDRVFLPGFAFRYRKRSLLWDKLLTGKSARLIITMDAPKLFYLFTGMPGYNMMKRGILGFCGIKPVKLTAISNVRFLKEKKRNKLLNKIEKLGRRVK